MKFNSIEITNVTNSSPCVITTNGDHNFSTGDIIFIQSTTINDLDKKNFEVTVLSSNTFSVPVNTNTTSSSGNVSKENLSTRIFIKNQTKLNENGIYYISSANLTTGSITFTRTSDFDSMYVEHDNEDGDIRPGDYAYISDGIHDANKNHAFVLANEHMKDDGSGNWTGTDTEDHTNRDAIFIVAFTGAETIHIDDVTIELDGIDRHLQVKDSGISFAKLNNDFLITNLNSSFSNTTLATSQAVKTYVDNSISSQIPVTSNNSGTTLYPVFVDGTSGNQDAEVDTNLEYNASTNTLTTTTFSGSLSGNATTASALQTAVDIGGVSFDGSTSINLPGVNAAGNQDTSGTATNATNIGVTATSTNATYYPVFVDGTSGNQASEVNSSLQYNPSSNTLTATTFSGALSGNATTASNAATASALQTAVDIGGVSFDGSTSINLPGVNAAGNQDTSGTATNATNIGVTATSTNATYYPVFVDGTSGNQASEVNSSLQYNPFTGLLKANGFDASGNKIKNVDEPTDPNDAASKTYVDSVAEGLHILEPCLVGSFSNYSHTNGYTHGNSGSGYDATSTLVIDFSTGQEGGNGGVSGSLKSGIKSHINLTGETTDFTITDNNSPSITDGTYHNVSSESNADGVGALFDITVSSGSITSLVCVVSGNKYSTSDTLTLTLDSKQITLAIINNNGLVYQIDGLEIVQQATSNDDLHHVVKYSNTEANATRIFIKNQTKLNENGIYYISSANLSTGSITFTRTSDFDSMYVEHDNEDGDIRAGDYSYISDGIHDANKNHAFVLANEHMKDDGSGNWTGTETEDHTDPNAIVVVAFTGAETIHIDDVTIELDGTDRHLQVKDSGISFAKLNDGLIVTEAEGISSNDNDITIPTSAATKDYVDSHISSQIPVTSNNSGTTLYPVFVDGTSGNQDAEVNTDLQYNASTNTLQVKSISNVRSLQSFYSNSAVEFTVTVASKDTSHRYHSQSGSGYKINGVFAPFLTLTPGTIYRFDLSDNSTIGHPFKFYTSVSNLSTEITNGVTVNGTQGSTGAYVQLIIDDNTPNIIYYQCSSHQYMGNAIQTNSNRSTTSTNVTVADESTDTSCNVLFTTGATGDLAPKSGTNLTFNSNTGILTATGFSGDLTGDVSIGNGTAAAPSLHFASDTDTGIYRKNTNQLGFSTAGVERFYVHSDGSVYFEDDIYTSYGAIRVGLGAVSQPSFSFYQDNNTGIYRVSEGKLGITTNSTQRLFVDSTGLNITSGGIVHTPSTVTPDSSADKVLYWDATDNTFKKANFSDVCFLEGTKFTLADKSQKNIEDLTLEDNILSYYVYELSELKNKKEISNWKKNEFKGYISQSGIRNIWVNSTDKYLIINNKLHITNFHIIHIRRDDKYMFTFAENVRIGDELLNLDMNYEKITEVQQILENVNVYNFELKNDMTSFADNYLVHNFCETCSGMSEFI